MNICKTLTVVAIALAGLLGFEARVLAQPMSGLITKDDWSISWNLNSVSGIRLTNVTRKGVRYLANASMPAVRVDYDGRACGPFLDRIKWSNINPDSSGNKLRVSLLTDWIRVWVSATVESYRLEQSWWFSRAAGAFGTIVPELRSSGLQCKATHRHHPYWRMDIDVVSSVANRSITVKNGVHTIQPFEWNGVKEAVGNEILVTSLNDVRKVLRIFPGPNDGTFNTFARWDYGGRRFPSTKNDPWLPLDPNLVADIGDLEDINNPATTANMEVIDNADLEYWYVAHLQHSLAQGAMQVLGVGPTVQVSE